MTRADVSKYSMGTPEYVVMHARYQKSRGRNLSAVLGWAGFSCRNPIKALKEAEFYAYFPPTINLQGAKKVAEIFRRLDKVQTVEVFGSVARGQEGHDLDLILVCDEETSRTFISLVNLEAKMAKLPGRYHGYAFTRSNIAEKILVADIASENNQFNDALAEFQVGIDIFIFPPNWRDRLAELQGRMEHDDPKFMRNIAKDARRIA